MAKKNLYFGIVALALVALAGCTDDDSGTHSTTVPECVNGTTQCSPEGALMTCTDGKYVTSPCEKGCQKGACVKDTEPDTGKTCDVATYKPSCKDGTTQYVCESGIVGTHSCSSGEYCDGGECKPSGNVGDTCDVATFKVSCQDSTHRKACEGGQVVAFECNPSETCQGGYCKASGEPRDTCDEATYRPSCDSSASLLVCQGGFIHRQPCGANEICVGNECKPDGGTACDAATYPKHCVATDNKTVMICDGGVQKTIRCADELVCKGGDCVPEVLPQPGDPCDGTFRQSCYDSSSSLICNGGTVTEIPCGDLVCRDGSCKPRICTVGVDMPYCDDNTHKYECISGEYIKTDCGTGKHCAGNDCVENTTVGSDCDLTASAQVCINDTTYHICEADLDGNGKISEQVCSSDKGGDLCVQNKCMECDPSKYEIVCNATNDGRVLCSAEGKLTTEACGSDAPICHNGRCVECVNDATFQPSCVLGEDTKYRTCSAEGRYVINECTGGMHCSNGTCTSACDDGHPCGEHYSCNAGTCELNKECEPSSAPICDAASNSIKRCVGLGWYESEACTGTDTCEGGKCVGHECDSATYGTQCGSDGVTPQYCLDGHIIPLSACPSGVCVDGVCRACNPASYVENRCFDAEHKFICQDYNLYYTSCKASEKCEEGLGCVSKCGATFKDSCINSKMRQYCDTDGSVKQAECTGITECVDGACVSDYGEICDPTRYANKCYSNVDLKVCALSSDGQYKVGWRTCGSGFCGTSNGKVGCYQSCDSIGANNCMYNTAEQRAWAVVCAPAQRYDGSSTQAYAEVDAFCSNGASVICEYDTVNNRSKWNSVNCSEFNGTCNSTTGMCDNVTSCPTPGGSCSGNTAISCISHGSVNMVKTKNCNEFTGGVCVVNSKTNEAGCYATATYNTQTYSSLGICDGTDKYQQLTSYSGGAINYLIYPCGSSQTCHMDTFSYNGTTYSYAFCQ